MTSLKLNYSLTTVRTVLSFFFPLIIFPYVSRILEPSGIGKVEFANSIVSYFVLFTALGIPIYGMREIARVRDNKEQCSRAALELSFILLITTITGYVLYFVLINFVPYFNIQKDIFFIIAPTIFLSSFNYDWFYQGIENQTYITVRFIIIKLLQIILIFLLVKNTDHYLRYAAIFVGLNGISSLFNILYLRKYIHFVPYNTLNFSRHIKSVLIIFASIVAVNVYMQLDVTMTGIVCTDAEVGLYTAANRIIRIVIAVVTVFSTVITPRLENCRNNNDVEAYNRYLNLSLHYVLIFGIPCCLGIISISKDVITLFAGEKYLASVITIKLLSPIIIFVGLASFVGLQLLFLNREEYKYTIAVSIAAVVNAICNVILIPRYAQNGAALGTVIAEGIGLILQIVFARKYFSNVDFFSFNSLKYVIAGLCMYFILQFVPYIKENVMLHCLLCITIGTVVYASVLILLKEKLILELISQWRYKKITANKQ